MNDREMLERLEFSAMFDGRCPECYMKGPHTAGCELGKHLHPEAVVGSAEWADAQGEAGMWVVGFYRGKHTAACTTSRRTVRDGVWVQEPDAFGPDRPTACSPKYVWELYAPPEPETVRWALERELGGLRMHLPNGNEFYPIHELATCRVVSGYRLKTFVGHTKSGAGVNMGNLTKVWIRYPLEVCPTPGPQGQGEPVWADTAVMERVAQ